MRSMARTHFVRLVLLARRGEHHGDKIDASIKTEIETALSEAKAAVEGGDPDQMTEKTNALAQAAMKLGEAMGY